MVVIPILRNKIVDALPQELGFLLKTLPSPFEVNGEFSIIGAPIEVLAMPLSSSSYIMKLCRYSSQQMQLFHWLQRSMDIRTPMQTIAELIKYKKTYQQHRTLWGNLCHLWAEACRHYCAVLFGMPVDADSFYSERSSRQQSDNEGDDDGDNLANLDEEDDEVDGDHYDDKQGGRGVGGSGHGGARGSGQGGARGSARGGRGSARGGSGAKSLISFDDLLGAADALMRKRIHMDFQLQVGLLFVGNNK
jgi:uncharacterized membrane protein YgcG